MYEFGIGKGESETLTLFIYWNLVTFVLMNIFEISFCFINVYLLIISCVDGPCFALARVRVKLCRLKRKGDGRDYTFGIILSLVYVEICLNFIGLALSS